MRARLEGDLVEYLKELSNRCSEAHYSYMLRHIAGPVIHSEVVYNFMVQGRPRWKPLSPIYARIKAGSHDAQKPNKQPQELGRYPVPTGNINVRTAWLFGSLGTIFHLTATSLSYGTVAPHADDVMKGGEVKRIWVNQDRRYPGDKEGTKGTIHVSYYKTLKKPVRIPARPFDHVAVKAWDAIAEAMARYMIAFTRKNRTILIPPTSQPLASPGGRRVYVRGRGG
jgi:phage gpG-like protein